MQTRRAGDKSSAQMQSLLYRTLIVTDLKACVKLLFFFFLKAHRDPTAGLKMINSMTAVSHQTRRTPPAAVTFPASLCQLQGT